LHDRARHAFCECCQRCAGQGVAERRPASTVDLLQWTTSSTTNTDISSDTNPGVRARAPVGDIPGQDIFEAA